MPVKLVRRFPKVVLEFPQKRKPTPAPGMDSCINTDTPQPFHHANQFICLLEAITQPAKRRFHILEKHKELFDTYPIEGTSLEVVRARCVYRLQYLGHEQTKTKMGSRFLKNYKAIMAFSQTDPWSGCTPEVAELGKLVSLSEREVSMSGVKKVAATAKKVVKAVKKSANVDVVGKRQIILGDLGVTETIRYMAKVLNAGAKQIEVALKSLGAEAKMSTIHAQSHRVRKGLLKAPSITASQVAALKNVIPPEEAIKPEPKKIGKKGAKVVGTKAAIKAPVKIVKKVNQDDPKVKAATAKLLATAKKIKNTPVPKMVAP